MKVSITFDKSTKQSNKKLWVKQIQSVVDKLNNRCQSQNNSKIIPQPNPVQSTDSQSLHSAKKYNQRQKQKQRNDNSIVQQLISIHKTMEDRFSTLTYSVNKISDKLCHVEKRLSVLQAKQSNRESLQEDFDCQFAQIAYRYQKIKKERNSCQQSKKYMVQTADSNYTNYTRFLHQMDN